MTRLLFGPPVLVLLYEKDFCHTFSYAVELARASPKLFFHVKRQHLRKH